MVGTKVLIGVVTQEYARRSDFYDHYYRMERPKDSMNIFSHDRSPASGRNFIINQALENNCSHILFMDDDVVPEPNALLQLLEHDVDVVSGLYLSRAFPHQPLIFDIADEFGACFPSYLMGNEPRLVKIVAAGLGFCLFKTDVFKTLEKPWVRLGELDPAEWCDDIGLFKRVRESNFDIYCDMDCCIGHIGSFIIKPNKQNGKWFSGYNTGGKGIVNVPQFIPIEDMRPA